MFGFINNNNKELENQNAQLAVSNAELESKFAAINKAMAVIEFTPSGIIVDANENFLTTVGYKLDEIKGLHHKIFCDASYAKTSEYTQFWQSLNRGNFVSGQFDRLTKSGATIWLEASYNPVYDQKGNLVKVIKFASDITESVETTQQNQSMTKAIGRAMAVIEFNLNGEVITANDNFLQTVGYSLEQIIGQHHRMFCPAEIFESSEYQQFWRQLNQGEYVSGQFKRVDSHGNEVWLEATYNPIFDTKGNLVKVIKFATNVSDRVNSAHYAKELVFKTSKETDESTHKGAEVVQSTISLMAKLAEDIKTAASNLDALNKQSDEINNIVSTISSIADQTNLLALNAAIEAARAGEHGRGFAVVADEVRQLAARTSESTSEITNVVRLNVDLAHTASQTMESSIEQVDSAVSLVEQVNDSIAEINAGVSAIVQTVNDGLSEQ